MYHPNPEIIALIVLISFWMFTSKHKCLQAAGLISAVLTGVWIAVTYGSYLIDF